MSNRECHALGKHSRNRAGFLLSFLLLFLCSLFQTDCGMSMHWILLLKCLNPLFQPISPHPAADACVPSSIAHHPWTFPSQILGISRAALQGTNWVGTVGKPLWIWPIPVTSGETQTLQNTTSSYSLSAESVRERWPWRWIEVKYVLKIIANYWTLLMDVSSINVFNITQASKPWHMGG